MRKAFKRLEVFAVMAKMTRKCSVDLDWIELKENCSNHDHRKSNSKSILSSGF